MVYSFTVMMGVALRSIIYYCKEWIDMEVNDLVKNIKKSKGEEKRQLLTQLCDYRCKEADDFLGTKISKNKRSMLPYYCFSVCDSVSNYAAEMLDTEVNRMIIFSEGYCTLAQEDLFTALCMLCFKQSDKFIEVLRKIGNNYDRVKMIDINFYSLLYSEELMPFIRKFANKLWAASCEKNFIRLLNDILICTYVRSKKSFGVKLRSLYTDYPQAYSHVAFFIMFTENESGVFDEFADANRLSAVLNTFSGTVYSAECKHYIQYIPPWFYGVTLTRYSELLILNHPLDMRWIDYFTYKVTEQQLREYYHTDVSLTVYRHFDGMLINLNDPENKQMAEKLFDYFYYSAIEHGGIEAITALFNMGFQDRAKNYSLYNVLSSIDLPKKEKKLLLDKITDYIEEQNIQLKNKRQIDQLADQIEAFKKGKASMF